MDHAVTKQTLFEHFAGQTTPLQRKLIEDWLRMPAHRELYHAWLEEWERGHWQIQTDDEAALAASLARIEAGEAQRSARQESLRVRHPFPGSFRWLAVAAVLAVCLSAGLYAGRSYLLYRTIRTGYGEICRETLPDGSRVILNANSTLRIPRLTFGWRTRNVWLRGEAAFTIRHTPSHQRFTVQTDKGLDVVVLGTEFTVFARPRGTKVVLNRGKLQVNYRPEAKAVHQLTLQPGDVMNLDERGTPRLGRTARPQDHAAWQEHRFFFDKTSMREIAQLLRETYGLTVIIRDDALAGRTFSGTFKATSANELLQLVAELMQVNYSRQNDTITFFD